MKTKLSILVLILLSFSIYAQRQNITNKICTYDLIEKNYLEGLKSDNLGLKISSAYYLGEIKSQKAVIPLMHMLRTAQKPEEGAIAALSLTKIGDGRGIYLLKKQAQFCNCERVRLLCERFYKSFMFAKNQEELEYSIASVEEEFNLAASVDFHFQLGQAKSGI